MSHNSVYDTVLLRRGQIMEENRLFWLAIFSFLIIMTVILLVEHSRTAIILIGAIIFCGLLYNYDNRNNKPRINRSERNRKTVR